jgi:hypothetical protein
MKHKYILKIFLKRGLHIKCFRHFICITANGCPSTLTVALTKNQRAMFRYKYVTNTIDVKKANWYNTQTIWVLKYCAFHDK